ncbi:MAG: hypothetical protein QG652_1355 [Pseudomonadota bacterium]|nr:hypothetical protein [Pseudomonadota bacterium]
MLIIATIAASVLPECPAILISRTHTWRNRLIILLASLLVLLALMFGVLRLLLPHVTDYGDNIREQLARQLGVPVNIQGVDAEIWWLSPRLKLLDVDIFDPDGTRHLLHVDEILVGFDWLASIRQQQLRLGFVAFNGSHLQVRHLADGRWQIQGLMLPAPQEGPLRIPPEILHLLQNTSIYLHDIQLDWQDEQRNNQHLAIQDVNIALLNDAPRHQLAIDLDLPQSYGGHVQLLADISGPLERPEQWRGRMYAALEHVRLKPWFNDYWDWFDFTADGQLDANIWIDWQQLQVQRVYSLVSGEDMALHYLNRNVHSWKLDRLIGNLRWRQQPDGWQADVSGLEIHRGRQSWQQPSALSLRMDEPLQQFSLRASYLQMDDLAYLAGLVNNFLPQPALADWVTPLQAWQPQGDLHDVDLKLPLAQPEALFFSSRFTDAGYSSQQANLPSVSGLDGRLAYQNRQARVQLDSQDVKLVFTDLFRQPLNLESLAADVFVSHDTSQTVIYAGEIAAVSPHIRTRGSLHLLVPQNAPAFMDLAMHYDQGKVAYTSHYLPTGIMDKDTVDWLDRALVKGDLAGGFLFYGQLQDFPFTSHEGVMLAQFDVANGELDYQPGWPAITGLGARVRFRNNAMLIDQGRGEILGAALADTTVSIDDLANARLAVNGDVSGPLPEMIRFVGESPLKNSLDFVSTLQTSGQARLGLDLQIPLAGDDSTQVSGRLALTGNELYLPEQHYRFKGVNGVLRFTEASLEAERLRASLDNYPLSLHIEPILIEGVNHSRIAVQGFAPLASLLAPLPDWQGKVSGGSDWQATIDIPMQPRADGVELSLAASGEMQGVASQLPLFLAKPAQQAGELRLDLDWLRNGDMNIRAALAGSYEARAERRSQRWQVQADSTLLRGRASFMQDFELDEIMTLDLERLDLAALQASQGDDSREPGQKPDTGLLPRQIPPLKAHIAQLDWGQVQLRNVNLHTRRTGSGMEIDLLELNGPQFSLNGRGSWQSSWRVPHVTRFDFRVKADDLGASLSQMGLGQNLEQTRGEAEFHWRWQDAPQNFSWARLNGDASLHLQEGRIQHVEAGAGRLLGIFNFRTLLSLDFGEQMREGFAFDDLDARFSFANGNAYSNDFIIKSKVAEISMQGRIGLVQEDFDQTITVVPGVGNTLTLIGTVAGGPITGVVVHIFQKLLRVDRIAQYKYTVKGSWDKPSVTLIDAPETVNNENNDL